MLSWLESISYKNNEIPHFNDSVDGVALSPKELFIYANSIGIKWNKSILDESGYRKFSNEKYECIIDVGPLGPHYLLGHSHSDISNFEFRFKSIPFIVDTGTSTYENNKTRIIEKSTNSHNTIMVNDISQSEMWNSFRVGRIAKVTNLFEENNFVSVSHNGYSHINMQHCREFLFNDNSIMIKDKVKGPHLTNIKSSLHFHPDRKIKLLDNSVLIDDKVELKLINHIKLKVINYDYCEGFNKTKKAKKLISFVNNESLITINF